MVRVAAGVLAMVLSLMGCAPEQPAAAAGAPIVDGTREHGEPAVVVVRIVGGVGLCSGTLISPHVVLTAKHCVQGSGADSVYPPAFLTVGFGDSAGTTDIWRTAAAYTTPGRYTSSRTGGLMGELVGKDIGVIVLRPAADGSLPDVEPIPIRRDAPLDRVGQPYTAIGFGQTPGGGSGLKYKTTSMVDGISGGVIYSSMTICSGDSGGPMIQETPERRVFGVASFGEADACPSRQDGHNRVDLFLGIIDRAMIEAGDCPALEDEVCNSIDDNCDGEVDEGCARLGEACTADADCAFAQLPDRFDPLPDPVTCADTPAGRVCTHACDLLRPETSCSSVELPFTGDEVETPGVYCGSTGGCEGLCVPGAPGSGAPGDTCAADTDCATLACTDPGDGARRCLARCIGDAGICDVGEVCAAPAGSCGACVDEDVVVGARGLGEGCEDDGGCASGMCLTDGAGGYCSRACMVAADCPDGFHCRDAACYRGPRGALGDPCTTTEDCIGGTRCIDGERSFCSRDCGPGCPEGSECAEGSVCRPPGGLLGEPCDEGSACASGICADSICAQVCTIGTDCPAGFECRRQAAGGGLCVDPAVPSGGGAGGGGCRVAPSESPSGLPVMALALALLVLGRRRRRGERPDRAEEP